MNSFPDANDVLRDAGADALRRQLDMNRRPYIRSQNGRSAANPRTLPIIRRDAGQLSQTATEAEQHLIAARVPFFQRAGRLVRPITDTVSASNERTTKTAALRGVTVGYMRDQMGQHDAVIELTEGAKELLVEKGYDPTMGARPLRRAIQRHIEDPLADFVLGRELGPGATILVDRKNDDEVDITVIPAEITPEKVTVPPDEPTDASDDDSE
jgi:hypothetical protein